MPYKENYNLIPTFPYDTSKACADMIAKCYSSDIFNLPIIITRFSNIYGSRIGKNMLQNFFINMFLKVVDIIIFTSKSG